MGKVVCAFFFALFKMHGVYDAGRDMHAGSRCTVGSDEFGCERGVLQ